MILGVDESHRGCLVGRLYVACVMDVPDDPRLKKLDDSKKLSEERRDELAPIIKELCKWGIGWVESSEIDDSGNVWHAEQVAIDRAVEDLRSRHEIPPFTVLIMDGNAVPKKIKWPPMLVRCIVKADAKHREVMAASILAKTEADSWLSAQPGAEEYGWKENHGYVNPHHMERLRSLGPPPIFRKSFVVKELESDPRFYPQS